MSKKAAEVLHGLLKKGWIDRMEDSILWSYYKESDVQDEVDQFKPVFGFEIIPVGERIYLTPTLENDIFLKTNQDYRRDIKADNSVKARDLYLMNYLTIYMIFLFFGGSGNNPNCRDYITKETAVEEFTKHCQSFGNKHLTSDCTDDGYSETFLRLTEIWLTKIDGDVNSTKFDNKYGILNRVLAKLSKIDEIFDVRDNEIRPTRKMRDLMPYFLRKERINEIQKWLGGEKDAADN